MIYREPGRVVIRCDKRDCASYYAETCRDDDAKTRERVEYRAEQAGWLVTTAGDLCPQHSEAT